MQQLEEMKNVHTLGICPIINTVCAVGRHFILSLL